MPVSSSLFDAAQWTPHGFCLSWDPPLIALHVVSDVIIAGAYYSIPLAIGLLLRRRPDLAFSWVAWLFAVFILACGTTHVIAIWTLWYPDYLLDGLVKAVTAVASLATAAILWPLLPRVVALPSLAGVLAANEQLQQQIRERDAAVAALKRETAERMRAEAMLRQSQKMEAVGQLTGGIAHDFNNMLQVVQANLELLRARLAFDDPRGRYLDRALDGVTRGSNVTRQLLAFARKQSLEHTPFAATARVAALSDLLRSTLGVAIQLDLPAEKGQWLVDADPNQFENALLNLAINGRDAMPSGGRLTIDVDNMKVGDGDRVQDSELEPGDYVRVRVTDTGSGMSPEVRNAAFEPFFTTKPVGQGSGLGLSQVYGFAKQSQGHVTLDSAPGQGTVAALYLRRAHPATPQTTDSAVVEHGRAAAPVAPNVTAAAKGGLAQHPPLGASSIA